MDTDDSLDDAVVGVVTTLLLLKHKNKSKRKKRRYWVHPYNHINLKHGSYIVSKELSEHPDKFQSFYRMSVQTFRRLVSLVGPHIIRRLSFLKLIKYCLQREITRNKKQKYRTEPISCKHVSIGLASLWRHMKHISLMCVFSFTAMCTYFMKRVSCFLFHVSLMCGRP